VLRGKTTFVVGAGASKEFGLPLGTELALKISDKLNVLFDGRGREILEGDRDLFYNVARGAGQEQNLNPWQQAAWLIRDGIILAHSIDDFLDAHQHDRRVVEYGKAAIAKCILEAESESTLFFDRSARSVIPGRPPTIDMRQCASSWLAGLMRLLVRRTPYVDRARILDQCSFVIFNYDRCVEHFFLHALQRFYNISEKEACEIVGGARIYHPYGMPGELESLGGAGQRSAFGAVKADFYKLGNTALKTYTDSVESDEIWKAVREAEKVVFLGFGFHDQNMSVLAGDQTLGVKSMLGTAFEMSESDVNVVRGQIGGWALAEDVRRLMVDQIELRNSLKASDIFKFYSKSL
jgi:hypothetical protein